MTPNAKWTTYEPPAAQTVFYTDPVDPTFGRLLRQYRERAGLSQTQLAKRAGLVTHSHISRLESASRAVTMTTCTALVRALDLDADDALRLYEVSGVLTDIREALALLPDELRGRLVA